VKNGLSLALGSVAALAVAGAVVRRGSAARAPGRIRRAAYHEVEPVFRQSGINLAPYEEPYEVFEVDGEVVGASSFGWTNRGDGKVASFSVAVRPSARRMGVGERLVKSLVRQHPGARFEPWVVSPKMAQLLEGLGFSSEGREWTPDSPHMTYEAPSRAERRAQKQRVTAPPPPPAPPAPVPEWTEVYRGPVRLDHLRLDGAGLAEAIQLRAQYAQDLSLIHI
jgi:GNAT superfamily N-acetyltransferase